MEKLANEWVIEARLPFLNKRHFEATIVGPVCVYWDWRPNIQVVMFLPIAKCQFSLHKSLVGELKVFPRATLLSIQSMVRCRAHVKFGLHVSDMGKPDVDALRLKELSGKQVVGM